MPTRVKKKQAKRPKASIDKSPGLAASDTAPSKGIESSNIDILGSGNTDRSVKQVRFEAGAADVGIPPAIFKARKAGLPQPLGPHRIVTMYSFVEKERGLTREHPIDISTSDPKSPTEEGAARKGREQRLAFLRAKERLTHSERLELQRETAIKVGWAQTGGGAAV